MTISSSITQTDVFTALRAFILTLVTCEVIRLPTNRVAMPEGSFVSMSPAGMSALATNTATSDATTRTVTRSTEFDIQIDCYGEAAGDMAATISTLLRDAYAYEQFAVAGLSIAPLYATDPQQLPLVDGEAQYVERWTFEARLQFNPELVTAQQTANTLEINLINVSTL